MNGQIFHRTYSGQLVLNSDCTGAVNFTDNLGRIVNLSVVFVSRQSEILFMKTDPGSLIAGSLKRL